MDKQEEIIEYAKEQYKIAKENMAKWQLFLEASNVNTHVATKQNSVVEKKEEDTKKDKVVRRTSTIGIGTLKSQILSFIKTKDSLYSGRDIYDFVVNEAKYTGNYTSFAGKLSIMVNKGIMRKIVIDDVPNNRKYWYGMKEWWEGDVLKAEYQTKLDAKVFA